jgi:hypothetical protein
VPEGVPYGTSPYNSSTVYSVPAAPVRTITGPNPLPPTITTGTAPAAPTAPTPAKAVAPAAPKEFKGIKESIPPSVPPAAVAPAPVAPAPVAPVKSAPITSPESEKHERLPETPRSLPTPEPGAPPERTLLTPGVAPLTPTGAASIRDVGESPEPEAIHSGNTVAEHSGATIVPVSGETIEKTQILTGRVELWRKTWRLRYAAVDTDDAHGGRVTLLGGPTVDELHEGQRIRVRGILIPSPDRAAAPTFHVQFFEVVN